jgi:HD-GYP domain-containing protein (c-di-GMP phosphodiesterase class II)
MNEYGVREIPNDSFFSKTTYLDQSFVVTAPEMPFTRDLRQIMDKWSYTVVYSDGNPHREYRLDVERDDMSSDGIAGLSLQSDGEKIEKAEDFINTFQRFVDRLFIGIRVSDELDFNQVTEKIKSVIEFVKEDHRFLMRVLQNAKPAADENYLSSHTVRSTIIAIIIGLQLKLAFHKVIDLGVASLVHEIGMLKLPQQVYLSDRPLNPQEQKVIMSHPVLGYSMLKGFDFPLAINLAALEHHERENGTGYPRRLLSDKISLYSKIIAVACSYEALSAKRPHKEAKDGFTGMVELLKNEGKRYNDTVVRALVLSLSLYPIGLYVLLSNGKKGQVVDVNPEEPRYPIVQVFGEFTPDGKNKHIRTAANALSIVRPLTRMEIET